jgi:peptidoglycan hydrolase-like protein with peptidoglycan-binding domain
MFAGRVLAQTKDATSTQRRSEMRKILFIAAAALTAGMFAATDAVVAPANAQTTTKTKAQKKSAAKPAVKKKVATKRPNMKKMVKKAKPANKTAKVQSALNKNGAKLKVDGRMGRKTRAAIRAFQKSNKLKATGRLDKVTVAKLKI